MLLLSVVDARAQSYSVVNCGAGSTTTITGTVYDPAGKNPLPNVLVYVPQSSLAAFVDGVNVTTPAKDSFTTLISGNPLVSVTTGSDGTFSLSGVPAGTGVPLVIQSGRWRRQFVISSVAACTTTPLYSTAATTVGTDPATLNTSNVTQGGSSSLSGFGEATSLRFARNQNEGDIPHVALVTGSADALECTLRKVGLADSEFTDLYVGTNSTSSSTGVSSSSPAGRVSLYQRNAGGGSKAPSYTGSTTAVSNQHTGYDLIGSATLLDGYNVLMLPCAGQSDSTLLTGGSNLSYAQNVATFTGAGGRVFSTHFSSDLLRTIASISGAANWVTPVTPSNTSTGTATINQSSTDSNTMGEWLYGLNGGTEYSVDVTSLRISQTGTNAPTVNWATLPTPLVYSSSITVPQPVVEFSYYTPFTATSTAGQYGRVFFTDYHVNGSSTSTSVFPAECTSTMAKTASMSTQEQMLEYSLFQLMNFAVPQFVPAVSVTATTSPASLQAGDTGDNLTITLTNNSTTQPITLDAPVTVTFALPTGVTATSASAPNWTCATAVSTVACTLNSQIPTGASNTLALTVNVDPSISGSANTLAVALNSQEFSTNPNYSLTLNITPAIATVTTLGPPATVSYGSTPTLTATVTAATGTPSGTVSFYDGSTLLGTSPLSSGTATLAASALAPGDHIITSIYNATLPYLTSTSSAALVTVSAAATTTTLTPASTTVTAGSSATLTANVASAYGTPTGTVTFSEGATVLGTGTLNNGQASLATSSSLAVGSHNITVTYAAQSSWAASTSPAAVITVNAAATTTTLTPALTTVTVGSSATLTANVASAYGTPTGTVTFSEGATVLGTATLSNGQAILTSSSLAVGSHSITVTYAAQSSWAASTSPIAVITVNAAATTTTLTPVATTVTAGSATMLTAAVSSTYGTPTGTVTFSEGGTVLGTATLTNGQAILTTSSLAVGSHNITVAYAAQGSWGSSIGLAATVTVNASATTTTLTPASTTVTAGSAATLTAAVNSTYGTPTGTVTFSEGSTVLGTATLTNGHAAFTSSSLAVGSHNITATYAAQSFWASSSSAAAALTVNAAATTTTLTPASSTVSAGSPTTLIATVASSYGTPTGTVIFSEGSTVLGTATLSNGQASLSPSTSLAVGSHIITASYSAQSSWAASTSSSSVVTVNAAATTMTLTPASTTIAAGSTATLTVTVASTYGTPTGTVTFYEGSTVLGTATLNNGQASFTSSALAVGSHTISATYGAQSSWTASTGTAPAVTVSAAATTTTLTPATTTVTAGGATTLTAVVTSAHGTPTGTVTFSEGATVLGNGTLNNGQASFTSSSLAVGSHSISATYAAQSSWAASTSTAAAVTVINATTSTTLSVGASSVMVGSPITLTAGVASAFGTPTGTITFLDGSTALGTSALSGSTASLATSAMAVGTHTITAVYAGASPYAGSASTAQTVSVLDLTMSLSPSVGGASGSTPSTSITVPAEIGGSAGVNVILNSGQNTALPVNSTLTVTGQPDGTVITLTGNNWQATSASSWTYPGAYTLVSPMLTFKLPQQLASRSESHSLWHPASKAVLLSFMLLPFFRRGRKLGKRLALLAVLALSIGGTAGLTGCAANNGFYAAKSYRVTVTITAGTVSRVSYITLNVN